MSGEPHASLGAKALRGVSWSVGGNIGGRLLNVAANIAMARLIAPDQFGVFAVAMTVWVIVGTVAEFGLGSDLIRAEHPRVREATTATLAIALSSGLAALTILGAGQIALAFGSPDSTGVIRLMALSVAISGFAVVPCARLQRDLRQRAMVLVNLTGAVGSAAVMLSLAAAGLGPGALAWGQIAGQTVIVVAASGAARYLPRLGFDRAIAAVSLRFCLPLVGANLVSWLLLTVDNLIVARVLGPVQLGFYVLAFNISSWPMTVIGQALRVVALPVFAQLGEPGRRNRALVAVTPPVLGLSAPIAMLLATMAAPVVDLLYGERWHEASAALAGLAVFGGMRVLMDVVATFLIAAGRPATVLVVQVVWVLALIPAMVLGSRYGGLHGAGWSHVAVALGVALPAYWISLRRVGVDVRRLAAAATRPLAWLVPATLVCLWLGRQDADPVLLLGLAGVVSLAFYVAPMAPSLIRNINGIRAVSAAPEVTNLGGVG